MLARQRRRNAEAETPSWLAEHLAAHRDEGEGRGITPLESATGKEKGPAKYRSFCIFRLLAALAKAMP
jgi:hypothetical protein